MYRLSILLILFVLVSCGKDDHLAEDGKAYIFGHFFGECFGEQCVEIFKLQDGSIFEDTNDQYPSINGNTYNWSEMTGVEFEELEALIFPIPDELYEEEDVVIGMPDAGDWGGIYFQVHTDADVQFWFIDYLDDNIPDYLSDFTADIKQAIEQLP